MLCMIGLVLMLFADRKAARDATDLIKLKSCSEFRELTILTGASRVAVPSSSTVDGGTEIDIPSRRGRPFQATAVGHISRTGEIKAEVLNVDVLRVRRKVRLEDTGFPSGSNAATDSQANAGLSVCQF